MNASLSDTATYRHILVVVDLTQHSGTVGAKAKTLAEQSSAQLSLLHVVEYLPIEPLGEALLPTFEVETEAVLHAKRRLLELATTLGIPSSACYVEAGPVKSEIVRTDTRLNADLIVLGSRERHGLSILLNLTEDTVLHAAHCDVLAVRIKST